MAQPDEMEIDFFELISYLWSKKKQIAFFVLAGMVISLVVAFIITRRYVSETTIYPVTAKETPSLAISPETLQFLGLKQESPLVPVLESLYLRQRVVRRLGLEKELLGGRLKKSRDPLMEAAERLKERVKVKEELRKGTISVAVKWEKAEQAQKVALCYLEVLREILNEKAFTLGKMNRLFYQEELAKTEAQLRKAQERLTELQESKKVILPDKNLEVRLSLYSSLLKEKLELESKLRSLLSVYATDHPMVKVTRESLGSVSRRLEELEAGMYQALEVVPEYTVAFGEVQRLKVRYEALSRLFEEARLQELKENLYFEVVDPPVVPYKPAKPKRKLIVALGFVLSVFLSVLGVLGKRAFEHRQLQAVAQEGLSG